jgi:DNA-binding transcriptional ArsR family regulator
MEKRFLEGCLAKGMSLEAIGRQVGKHPSTVSYWLKKHGLAAVGRVRHSPKGKIEQGQPRRMVADGFSIAVIATELDVSKSTVRYWLRRLGLQTRRATNSSGAAVQGGVTMACPKHGLTTFHARSDGGGYRCGKCSSLAVMNRRRKIKRLLVTESGGKCSICGFAGHPAALQFHHRDPKQKDFQLGHPALTRSLERMRAEASKCVLLCANCHSMVEAGVLEVPTFDR